MTRASRRGNGQARARRRNGQASPQTLELLQLIQGWSSIGFLLALMKAGARRS